MKRKLSFVLSFVLLAAFLFVVSCQKQDELVKQDETISNDVLTKIAQLGFSNKNVVKVDDGYLVEGDITLTNELLNSNPSKSLLRIGNEEQYRTTNLVTGLPRTIKVSVSSKLPASYIAYCDDALAQYNALNLTIKFQRVTSGANISLVPAPKNAQYLGKGGFPTSTGQPYGTIELNSRLLNGFHIPTIITHEIGHCIGFRHTDYYNRAISCGGSVVNEGASTVGAILIPGTPSTAENGSWMLSCIDYNMVRNFTNNDKVALNYLY